MCRLIEAFYASVQTDLSATDISKLLCLGYPMGPKKITPLDFPAKAFTASNIHDPVLGYTFIWDVDFFLLRAYVQYFNHGSWSRTPLSTP